MPVCCSPGWEEAESLVATLPDLWELLAGCWDCNVHCRCLQYSSLGLPESLGNWELLFCFSKALCCELHNEHKLWEGNCLSEAALCLPGALVAVAWGKWKGTETRDLGLEDSGGSGSQARWQASLTPVLGKWETEIGGFWSSLVSQSSLLDSSGSGRDQRRMT